jgi:hypothetical protein
MGDPSDETLVYARAIRVKSVLNQAGPTFELDLKVCETWISTEPLSAEVIEEIRTAAADPSGDGIVFEALQRIDGRQIEFLVDRDTDIR